MKLFLVALLGSSLRVADAHGALTVPTEELTLLEGQDLKLTSISELRQGSIWSDRRCEMRPIAPGLDQVIERLLSE